MANTATTVLSLLYAEIPTGSHYFILLLLLSPVVTRLEYVYSVRRNWCVGETQGVPGSPNMQVKWPLYSTHRLVLLWYYTDYQCMTFPQAQSTASYLYYTAPLWSARFQCNPMIEIPALCAKKLIVWYILYIRQTTLRARILTLCSKRIPRHCNSIFGMYSFFATPFVRTIDDMIWYDMIWLGCDTEIWLWV